MAAVGECRDVLILKCVLNTTLREIAESTNCERRTHCRCRCGWIVLREVEIAADVSKPELVHDACAERTSLADRVVLGEQSLSRGEQRTEAVVIKTSEIRLVAFIQLEAVRDVIDVGQLVI